MATTDDVDRIARSYDDVRVGTYWDDPHAYLLPGTGGKGFIQRRAPRTDVGAVDPRSGEPFTDLIVVHTGTMETKAEILQSFPVEVVFSIPHFDGHPGVLAHLELIDVEMLEDLLDAAHRGKTA